MRTSLLVLLAVVSSCTPPSSPDGGAGGGFGFPGGGSGQSGGGSGAGGGGANDAGPTMPSSLPACDEGSTAPSDIGASCAAGSNLPLCVMQGNGSCEGVCIWDAAAPSTPRAYCSMACEQDTDCPGAFECQPQDCTTGPRKVCVRRVATGCTAVPAFGSTGRTLMSAPLKSVNAYVVGYVDKNVVTVRLMQGTTLVRELGSFPFGGFADTRLETSADRVWWSVPPLAVRIDANGIETFPIPTGVELSEFASLTSDGDVLAGYQHSTRGSFVLRADAGALVQTPAVRALYHYADRLEDGTLLGRCADGGVEDTCVTRDLVDSERLDYPSDAGITAVPGFAGASRDDFVMVTAQGRLFRRVGTQWVEDALVTAPTAGLVSMLGDAVYVISERGNMFAIDANAATERWVTGGMAEYL
ncbi:MAG: hypothetical protein ACO1OB_23680, partial [Archangium sp.]